MGFIAITGPRCDIELRYECVEGWPPLAWLAACPSCPGGSGVVRVRHGRGVETRPEWFCEAVWDGDYAAGRFDQTDIVFGSGGRSDGRGVTFVGSGTMVDRLHSMKEGGGGILISNSLVCLLAATGAGLDATYGRYHRDFRLSATGGIDGDKPELRTSAGPVRMTYHHNLRWDGSKLTPIEKPNPLRDFNSFERYHAFMDGTLARLAANMSGSGRSHPYRMLGTLSSGYDSPTAVALARPHGLREAITFPQAKHGKYESGEPIARPLGVELTLVDSEAWHRLDGFPEAPLLASNAEGEDVLLRGAESMLSGRVLLTGVYGDIIWGMNGTMNRAQLRRTDTQGSSMAEYRLWAGFLHCPLPFIGARQGRDLVAISRSAEMAPWDVGGGYSRPICRRIVETAGVPRDAFGVEKKATAVMLSRIGPTGSPLTPQSMRDYLNWSKTHAAPRPGGWGLKPITRARLLAPVQRLARFLGHRLKRIPRVPAPLHRIGYHLVTFGQHNPLLPYLFPWAIDRAKSRYQARGQRPGHGFSENLRLENCMTMKPVEQQNDAVTDHLPVELRDWLESFAKAVRDRDYEAGRALVDDGVVGFGSRAERAVNLDDLERRQWRHVWAVTKGFDFHYQHARGEASDSVGWAAVPWSSDGFKPDGRPFRRSGRATLVLTRSGGRWLAVHTHFSMTPDDPADNSASQKE